MAIAMNRFSGGGHSPTKDEASKAQPLDLLSSIAVMMATKEKGSSKKQPKSDPRTQPKRGLSRSLSKRSLVIPEEKIQERKNRKLKGLSRSLSRAALSSPTLTFCSHELRRHPLNEERENKFHSTPTMFTKRSTANAKTSSVSSPSLAFKDPESNCTKDEKDPRIKMVSRTSSNSTLDRNDEFTNNIYRSYEMTLPESVSAGQIQFVPTRDGRTATGPQTEIDDYNNDVVVCCPLYAPRLPNATESLNIANQSLEDKDNWGWYAE